MIWRNLNSDKSKHISKLDKNVYNVYICTYNIYVMDSKLTLKLDRDVIENAKKYASNKKLSLSRIIENYLQSLTEGSNVDDFEISPFVKSISTGKSVPLDIELKKEYQEYLNDKYK